MPKPAASGYLGVRRTAGTGNTWEARWRRADGKLASHAGLITAEDAARYYDEQVLALDRNACVWRRRLR